MCVSDKAQITQDVLSYLFENAAAQDTLEGIVEWWMFEQKIKRQTAEVKEVLDELAAQEIIIEHTARDSRTHYRVNRQKEKEIVALLKNKD
jgi:hypothetical protein